MWTGLLRACLACCLPLCLWLIPISASFENNEWEQARDRQDVAALEGLIARYQQAAQANLHSAEANYRLALAYSYAAEVAIELRDKKKAEALAEKGIEAAKRAASDKPSNAEY